MCKVIRFKCEILVHKCDLQPSRTVPFSNNINWAGVVGAGGGRVIHKDAGYWSESMDAMSTRPMVQTGCTSRNETLALASSRRAMRLACRAEASALEQRSARLFAAPGTQKRRPSNIASSWTSSQAYTANCMKCEGVLKALKTKTLFLLSHRKIRLR